MAPFYTVLALWVGGIVLVAVLKTELSKSDIKTVGKVKPYQEYFGRYLIFMVISLLQATITALGDVFFLKIQCENLFLFILTTWITIIVFFTSYLLIDNFVQCYRKGNSSYYIDCSGCRFRRYIPTRAFT